MYLLCMYTQLGPTDAREKTRSLTDKGEGPVESPDLDNEKDNDLGVHSRPSSVLQ